MTTVATPVALPKDGLAYFEAERRFPFPFLLQSVVPSPRYGRQSLMGSDPFAVMTSKGRKTDLWIEGRHREHHGDPFQLLRELLREFKDDNTTDAAFCGGAVGYFGYDIGRRFEDLPPGPSDDQDFPDLFLAFHDRVIRLDHENEKAEILEWEGRKRKRAMDPELYGELFVTPESSAPSNFTREEYIDAVLRAKEYIGAGDIYQVNLSQRFCSRTTLDSYDLYKRLSEASPSSYAAYLELGNRSVLSSSPEQFLGVAHGKIVTRPIKGTIRRGDDEQEDEKFRARLFQSPKDDAELAMIVDLERNDLGRVCEFGTVEVTEPKVLETHPNVFHLSARIEGSLKRKTDLIDVLRATFPGGSITGAPKIRSMEIIDELEPTRRAVYTGAIGYLTFDGRMDLNIAIRTMLKHGHHVTFQVGGAIVWDSDPADEYEETLVKARGMAKALGIRLE